MKPLTRTQFDQMYQMCHRTTCPKLTVIRIGTITQHDISAWVLSAEAREFPCRIAKEAQSIADAYLHKVTLHDHTSETHVFLPRKLERIILSIES